MVEIVVQKRTTLLRRAVFESDEGFGGAPRVEQLTSDPGKRGKSRGERGFSVGLLVRRIEIDGRGIPESAIV
jgi:hypothetical protein